MFRTLGIRHLVVTDQHNQVMGMITRKDLMAFMVDEKITRIIDRSGVSRDDFTSPEYIGGGRGAKVNRFRKRSDPPPADQRQGVSNVHSADKGHHFQRHSELEDPALLKFNNV